MPVRFLILFVVQSFLPQMASSQEGISKNDYDRAVSYLWRNVENKRAFNLFVEPHWFPDSTGLWYEHHSPEGKRFLKITFPELEVKQLFDHQKLAIILSDSLKKEIDPQDLPLRNLEYRHEFEFLIETENKRYILDLKDYSLKPEDSNRETNRNEETSPDGNWVAFAKDYNLFLGSKDSIVSKQLSFSGEKGYEFASWYGWGDIMAGENGERPDHFSVDWSHDGKWLYTNVVDLRLARKMYLLDWSIDTLFRPNLLSYYRGSPGDTSMIYMEPVFYNVTTGEEIRPGLPKSTHINPISMRWSSASGTAYLQRQNRGYQNINLYRFDLERTHLELLYSESSETNIDNFSYFLAEKSGLIFFLSEKSGWRQIYALDLRTKQVKAVIRGEFYVNEIKYIDEEKQRIFFTGSGREEGRNPYHHHLYSISYDGQDLKLLTPEDLHHQVSLSPDGQYFVDNMSTATFGTSTVLRTTETGEIVKDMASADVSLLEGWQPPQIFSTLARDGITTIYGALWKPTNFVPENEYPIIDHSYTGPHTQMFPKDFRRVLSTSNQALAELGFVVMMVDGLGSSGRSKSFHNYSYKNLGGNLADHVLAIRRLGVEFSWIDTTRVGIFGHSAGGYDAGHAVLAYPDFYKVAVASSADHDHRMEKAWWPEMYMGWPVDSAYHQQSNITMAGNLKGKLLITHGGIDENVNPSATFKFAEALITADKPFDMLILPSQRHGYRGGHGNYFTKVRWNYFVKNLRGEEPIWDFEWDR